MTQKPSSRLLELKNLGDIQRVVTRDSGVNDLEGKRLAKLTRDRKVIVEIGAYCGRSAAFLASGLRHYGTDGHVYSVDVWKETSHLEQYKKAMQELGLEAYVTPIKGASAEVVKTWDKPIDFLFIDGNHSYKHRKQDYDLWSPFVVEGGLIVFHDYGAEACEGVERFVDSIPRDEVLCIGVHRVLWSGIKVGK